jgi:hypothetical protein
VWESMTLVYCVLQQQRQQQHQQEQQDVVVHNGCVSKCVYSAAGIALQCSCRCEARGRQRHRHARWRCLQYIRSVQGFDNHYVNH